MTGKEVRIQKPESRRTGRTVEDRGFQYYPAFLDLRHKRVVVIGAGDVATVKVRGLLPCGPEPLVVIAPEASAFVQQAAAEGKLEWQQRPYQDGDLAGADLAFGATDRRSINATVADEARRRRVPVLAVDDVPNCDFIAPSLVRRGDVIVAISTGGRSPAFARWVRERLDRELPAYWSDLLDVAATVRVELGSRRARIRPEQWIDALDADLERLVRGGDLAGAKALLHGRLTAEPTPASLPRGLVSLVGAGPGDPELLTIRGLRLLQHADAVVHDRLINPALLDYCRAETKRFDVGKASGRHSCRQEEINALLVRLGLEGKRVVRLKGGDPFVFGRGGEEALALAGAGVPFEIVPGVSSALAAPAAAGIPVTHRGMASSVTIATGHPRASSSADDHDWAALGAIRGSLVFLMAVENLSNIVEHLLANGRLPDEPAAMVQSGTTPDQRVIRAPLGAIVSASREAQICSPAILVVGATAALADVIGPQAPPVTSARRLAVIRAS